MAENWQVCSVANVASPIRNALVGGPFGSNLVSKDYVVQGIPVIRGQNMGERWIGGDFAFVSEEKAKQLSPNTARPRDLIFTQRGTLGQVSIVPDQPYSAYIISQSQMKLTVDPNKADALFLYYLFKSPEQQDYIIRNAFQTGVPHTNLEHLRNTPLLLPPLTVQCAIAGILGSLDDKIELNHRMNRTLESMARAVFRLWFVENEDAESWKAGTVGDVIKKISVGRKYDFKTALPEGTIPILDQAHFTVIGYHNDEPGVVANSDNPVIVFSNHRCYTDIIQFPFSAIQNVLPFVGEGVDTRWLYHATDGIIEYSEYKGHWPEFISKLLVIPPKELTQKFGEIVKPMHIKIMKNKEESRALASLRETLLPKLMRGEVRVKDMDR